jgi:xylulokinase
MVVLGIDSGTQSTKTVALDYETGEIIASAQAAYGLIGGLPPGHLEQHPQTWIEAVDVTLRKCVAQIGDRRGDVRAIGVSGQQHGMVALDAHDAPVRPAKLWCDTSTVEQCEQFNREFGGAAGLIELAGNAVLPGYTAPKILWLKQCEPENYTRSESFLLPHDYINFSLTGQKRMEYGDASGTALLDVRTRRWRRSLIDFIDPALHDRLPQLGSSLAPVGELNSRLQKEWGFSGNVIVSAGGGDNMMSAIGTGNVRAGVITASLGTSGTLYSFSPSPVIDARGEIAAFCDSTDHWLPLICTMNVTVVSEQVRKLFGWDHKQLEDALRSTRPGAGGLLFLPYLTGERTPNLPRAKGIFYGLTTSNMDAANLARAAVEGVTLGLAYGLNRFREMGLNVSEIRMTGGGSKSAAWRQIAADVFGLPVVPLATEEAAALGAAVQAGWTAKTQQGETPSIASTVDRILRLENSKLAQPDARNHQLYGEMLDRFRDLTKKQENYL